VIDTASDQALTFGGSSSFTIREGTQALSDPFELTLAALSVVAVTIRFGDTPSGITGHPGSRTTSFLAAGDLVGAMTISGTTVDHWYYLSSLDVLADADAAAVAVLGDSITDGRGSTTNQNDRWPDKLAERLHANAATQKVGVLNLGIGGNALSSGGLGPTAVARFDSQVLGQAGVKWLILLAGVNDIGNGAGPSQVIAAFRGLVAKARAHSVLAYGSPILPFARSQYSSPEHESERQAVNAWVRSKGNFDAVLDLDAAVREAREEASLCVAFDCGDGLHLNPAGYQALANAIDLALLTP
jgi:lysophospholipase L1-like esterase